VIRVLALAVLAACSTAPLAAPDDADPGRCTTGPWHCSGDMLQRCVDGDYRDDHECPDACTDALGCVLCAPGTGTCESDTHSHACNDHGTGYEDVTCDPVQGMTCGRASGICEGMCAPHSLGKSYIGCEYFPTVTGNMVSSQYTFAVVVTNTTPILATVQIEDGALAAPIVFVVPPDGVHVEKLPWIAALKLCVAPSWKQCVDGVQTDSAQVARGAYHLRSTVPVTVYQFNPLDYTLPDATESSFSNDASLLLPTNTWRGLYYVASWAHTASNPSVLAVTAWHDDTTVTLTTRADTPASGGAPAFTAGVAQAITLGAGDVVELTTRTGDLTGSSISSDQPVQVIGAHYAADVPQTTGFADHLEESMIPVEALGTRYAISAPRVKSSPDGKIQVVRVIATQAATTLTYDPPQPGAPTTIAAAGDFVDIVDTRATFLLSASAKVLVAQYMEGSMASPDAYGDPSMALAVPVEQFRSSYLFHAPTNYAYSYVDVIAPTGATVNLDEVPLDLAPIGTTGFSLARSGRLNRGPELDGNHRITGTLPFGISVYGYGTDTSYWYPGGLELREIIVN
jgi:hypothetical protein